MGLETKKVLFVGVRNEYCIVCVRAHNKKERPNSHICFRNWTGSSPAMEADMIVEGFCLAEQIHKVIYKYFVADGDSSVYAKIVERVSYGRDVRKCDCMNHAIKNYGKALHIIRNDTKINLNARKLLNTHNITSLQKIAQKAIYHCGLAHDLKEDLRNGPLHVFDHHEQCKDYYCQNVGSTTDSQMENLKKTGCYNYIYGKFNFFSKSRRCSGQSIQ